MLCSLPKTALLVGLCATTVLSAKIKFCNEADPNVGPCITEDIVFEKCAKIPDSNAKGDKDSSQQILEYDTKAGDFLCSFYAMEDCTKNPHGATVLGWVSTRKIASVDPVVENTFHYKGSDKWTARSYKCSMYRLRDA